MVLKFILTSLLQIVFMSAYLANRVSSFGLFYFFPLLFLVTMERIGSVWVEQKTTVSFEPEMYPGAGENRV